MEARSDEMPPINFAKIVAAARRQWLTVAASIALMLALGIGHMLTAVPVYTASASIIIDRGGRKPADDAGASAGLVEDETSIMSQLELLRSNRIALAVASRLGLEHDPLFLTERSGPLWGLFSNPGERLRAAGWLGGGPITEAGAERREEFVLARLRESLRVGRVAGTYVLTIDYVSADAALAARIAHAFADAYLADQLGTRYEASRSASDWLFQRIGDLRQKVLDADFAVQRFKGEKGLISSDGRLVSEQSLTEINSQLVAAQSATASAEAKYDRINKIVAARDLQGAVVESLSSNVVNDLRSKYLEASRRQTDIAARLGASHAQAGRLKGEMDDYRRLMFEELGRIAETYKNEYEIALARQTRLQDQLRQATGVSATANDAQVELRELEREAETYRHLYQTFLQRYQEAIHQQNFPVAEARLISVPRVPLDPSAPNRPLVLALSLFIGVLAGVGLAALGEYRDRFFHTSDEIRDALSLEPLGIVPLLGRAKPMRNRKPLSTAGHARLVGKEEPLANHVVDFPLSPFAETMRSAKIATDIFYSGTGIRKIGIVSVLAGEGKTTVAVNFAEVLASQGARVLLIDADLRNPGATRQLGRHAGSGLLEALEDSAATRDMLLVNPETGLAFLPAVIRRRIPYSAELLASAAMDGVIEEVSGRFDYLIFDLPPLASLVDARAMAGKLDAYLLVVEWGRAARSLVRRAMDDNGQVARKCAGVVLNKVDLRKMRFYQADASPDVYAARDAGYYGE